MTGISKSAKTQDQNVKPLVSILIPAFNAEKWIAKTIRSALLQTWQHKEIIIVDDGSTDRTLTIARQFASDSVTIVTQPHQGAASARNYALSFSTGDYIQWLDADDLLAPNKIERQIEAAGHNGSAGILLSSAWGQFLYRYDRANFKPSPLWFDLSPIEWLLRKLTHDCFMQTASWLVSRQLTEAAGPWNTALLVDDDGEYFCRVILCSEFVRFVSEAKVYYRYTGAHRVSYIGEAPEKLEAQWLSMKLHVGYLRSRDDSREARGACLSYLQTGLIKFYPQSPHICREACELARELGGQLEVPRLALKYHWIQVVLGWIVAKRTQRLAVRARWRIQSFWDQVMFVLESRILTDDSALTRALADAEPKNLLKNRPRQDT